MSTSQPENATAGPSASTSATPANASKLAKNPRLPATMITPSGSIQPSQKKKGKEKSRKQKARADKALEKAVERTAVLTEKVKGREERKAKRVRAKKAWE